MDNHLEYKYDLFISYAEAEKGWVNKYLIDALKQTDIRWHSESAFTPGTPHLLEIENSVRFSKRILVVLTPAYMADNVVGFLEVLGQSYGIETNTWPVIPLVLKSVDLPPRLAQLVSLNFLDQENWDDELKRLLKLLRQKSATIPAPRCPYPGLKPFVENSDYPFYGRDEEVSVLAHALRLHPFSAVIGPSGSGKSSLVLAGLIPALKENKFFDIGGWDIRVLRPGNTPLKVLEQTLSKPTSGLESKTLLLIVDQLEEVFTLSEAEDAESFQEKLLQLQKEQNVHIVITVRAYFYNKLMSSPLWSEIKDRRLELLPLAESGLKQAIIGPAESEGVHVEAALVERLVADAAGEPGILPFVQETLVLLWSKGLKRRYLPLLAYEAIILPRQVYGEQAVTGLHVALTEHANNAYLNLSPAERSLAKRVLLRLVQFGEGRKHTRRQAQVNDLMVDSHEQALFQQTLGKLTEARLLTRTGKEGVSDGSVDIAHEILIEGWPRLKEWVEKYDGLEKGRRRYLARAKSWLDGDKRSGFLDKIESDNVQQLIASLSKDSLGVDHLIKEYVSASNQKIKRQFLIKWALPAVAVVAAFGLFGFYNWFDVWSLKKQALSNSSLLTVSGGEKFVGTDDKYADDHEKPRRKIFISSFQIESFEVSNKSYQLCVKSGVCQEPSVELNKYLNPEYEMHPVVGINIKQAQTYCHWLDRRLPLFEEWEVAANEYADLENVALNHMPNGNEEIASTIPVNQQLDSGALTNTDKPINLIGNVWEWATENPYFCESNGCDFTSENPGGIMGGSFSSQIDYFGNFHLIESDEIATAHYGFRCVQV